MEKPVLIIALQDACGATIPIAISHNERLVREAATAVMRDLESKPGPKDGTLRQLWQQSLASIRETLRAAGVLG